MPPPKKPKNKCSWEELMSSIVESESTGACGGGGGGGGGQPLAACRLGPAVSKGSDFEAFECRDVPEDLLLKSSDFQGDRCRNHFQQTCPDLPKETQPDFDTDRRHHRRLRSVLLGLSDRKTILEAPETSRPTQSPGNGRATDSRPQNRSSPQSCPRTVLADTSPEHLSQLATVSTYLDARVLDATVFSEAEKKSGTCEINSAQVKKDSCELNASIADRRETRTFSGILEGRLGDGPPTTRPCQPVEVSKIATPIFADSTTNPVKEFHNAGDFRVLANITAPTRRPGLYRLGLGLPFPNLSLEQIRNQYNSNTDFQRVLLSPVLRNTNSDCHKNRTQCLSPDTQISNSHCPQEGRTATVKLNLKSLLSQDVSPPVEDSCNYINGSGVNKLTSKKASEDKRPSGLQTNERSAMSNADNGSSQELPSSSCAELVIEKSTEAKGVCRCQVCDDVASGFHYGVWSCEGCKAFFKRSLHAPVVYFCPSTNNCTIDKLRRKSCQACRLRKCHNAGMVAGIYRKDKKLQSAGKKRKLCENGLNVSESETGSGDNVGSSRDVSNRRLDSQSPFQSFSSPNQGIRSTAQTNSFVESLLAVEMIPRLAELDPSALDSRPNLLAGLACLINSQLIHVITWSKSLPDFSRSSLELQTRLLVASWSELLVLGTIWQSVPHVNAWVYAPNLHLTRDHCQMALVEPLFMQIMNVVQRFRHLRITQAEVVLLRITILLNNSVEVLERDPALANLRRVLDETWHQISTDGVESRSRVNSLLLTLPDVRQCSLMLRDLVRSVQPRDGVPAFELLNEMLDLDSGNTEVHVSVAETTSMD